MKFLIVPFFFLLITSCSLLKGAGMDDRVPVEQDEIAEKKDSITIVLDCVLDYVQVGAVERMYFPYSGQHTTLRFYSNGHYWGTGDCNGGISGTYKIDGKRITFIGSNSLRTMVKCPSSQEEVRETIEYTLDLIDNFEIKDKKLLLKQADKVLMVYKIIS